jgi:hypothetical protein
MLAIAKQPSSSFRVAWCGTKPDFMGGERKVLPLAAGESQALILQLGIVVVADQLEAAKGLTGRQRLSVEFRYHRGWTFRPVAVGVSSSTYPWTIWPLTRLQCRTNPDRYGRPESVSDLANAESRIRAAMAGYPAETRLALLRVLMAPADQRAEAVGELYRATGGGQAAELLIDLEQDRPIALIVADVLKQSVPDRQE